MGNLSFSSLVLYAEPVMTIAVLIFAMRRAIFHKLGYLMALLVMRVISFILCVPLLKLAKNHIEVHLAYHLYFYAYWTFYAVEAVLGFLVVYSVFNLAMEPLPGLQHLGKIMFRWAAGISGAIALGMAFGPHMTGLRFVIRAMSQLQQTQSVLTLCLLLFVAIAIRPMGLPPRSRLFGVCLGLGMLATTQLVFSAWISTIARLHVVANTLEGIATCLAMAVWIGYFAVPEPKRRLIVLPTTSPFLRWNQISQVLGDEPGYVALGPVTEEMFAPAEVEIMRRAAVMMQDSQTA